MYKPIVKFEPNEEVSAVFLFDDAKMIETKFGTKYRYSVKINGEEHQILATESLNAMIQTQSPIRNKTLTISKVVDNGKANFTLNGATLDELKRKASDNYSSALSGDVPAEPPTNTGSTDDMWREINRLQKELNNLKVKLENFEEKPQDNYDDGIPF